ncbi:unnamed protein product (macronuclear) [Paramecium tetraurelia]|uniref:Uncharacterized protein n=1 Tax=Paramecium tetraurelia TaxID=5888 RepID=A0DUX4_PARTE|nr:uncharacterized protein GSPATT00020503001 [Paramecium tetraurelia]CAK86841.1 unnamed protein product [Paramecium tetraurelia]|eukprot:XP_001454238.1 hypothetical protein (macronuclear) [Paramecium tetraurelia strain d4-2]
MQKTQPVSRDSQIFETLNYKDDSIQVQDLDFFGPWHKQNNSIQQQIAQIRKTYTSSTNHVQNDIMERRETQTSQVRMINTSFPNKRRKTRKISIDQSSQFVEKPKYNESRQVQRIIQEFFTDEIKEKKKKQRNYGFFMPQSSKSSSNTKCNGSSFQTTQAYFDKIALKMLKLMPNLQKSPSKSIKPLKNVNIKQKLILDMPINTKSYFPPQLLINTTKITEVTPQNLNSSDNKPQIKTLNFLAKTGKGPIWKVNNYTSL